MYSFANRIWLFIIVGELDSSCNFCTLYHRGFLKHILSALFCIIGMTVCDWFRRQAFAYRNRGRIKDLYSRSKLSCSTLRLLKRCSWKIRLFALLVMSLQCSFQFSCGVMVIPKNFDVFASQFVFRWCLNWHLFVFSKGFWIACTLFWPVFFLFSTYHTTLWECWVRPGVCFVLPDWTLTYKTIKSHLQTENFLLAFLEC